MRAGRRVKTLVQPCRGRQGQPRGGDWDGFGTHSAERRVIWRGYRIEGRHSRQPRALSFQRADKEKRRRRSRAPPRSRFILRLREERVHSLSPNAKAPEVKRLLRSARLNEAAECRPRTSRRGRSRTAASSPPPAAACTYSRTSLLRSTYASCKRPSQTPKCFKREQGAMQSVRSESVER